MARVGLDPDTVTAPLEGPDAGPAGGGERRVASLPDRYRDLGRIAAGAVGEVRRIRDLHLGRVLAIKLLRFEHVGSAAVRARFVAEIEVIAGLQHPGIISVHDRGELDDGRLWFTMQEVRGCTLAEVIDEIHAWKTSAAFGATPSGWTFRRALDAFSRIAHAVGHAHRQGVVHRDLKPENVMVGELGEALVMDWGLARRLRGTTDIDAVLEADAASLAGSSLSAEDARRTRQGEILGTPAYMSPEQAQGRRALHGPASDVYSLGAILYHLLSGAPPHSGAGLAPIRQVQAGRPRPLAEVAHAGPPLPGDLVDICEKAMRRDIEGRYPDGSAMAAEVVAFLDGARRREQALSLVEKARALEAQIAALHERRGELRSEARRLLKGVRTFDPIATKAPAWDREDEAAQLGVEAALRETEWLEGMHGALSLEPELPEAHDALAGHYAERLLGAEREGHREDATRFERLLRAHDRGRFRGLVRGLGALTLRTDPPGARVILHRYVEVHRRLQLGPGEELGTTPIVGRAVPRGSYLCRVRAEGHAEVRYPVMIERDGVWDGAPPGGAAPLPVPLPAEGEVGPGEVYVPPGWCWIGGDPDAVDALPASRVWVDGFVIGRLPVTSLEYMLYLNELVDAGHEDEAVARAPRRHLGVVAGGEVRPAWERDGSGRFVLPGDWAAGWPMVLVDWHAASAYCRHRARRSGLPFRLPNELEREKAARGVDGRRFPWGQRADGTFTCVAESHAGPPARALAGIHPIDEGPYGALDLAGNVRDWCINVWKLDGPHVPGGRLDIDPASTDDPDFRVIKGGLWSSPLSGGRAAARFGGRPELCNLAVGFRPVRTWPAPPGALTGEGSASRSG